MDLIGLFAGLVAAAIWGGMYVASKYVLDVIPPFTLLSIRLLLGFLSLTPFILWRRGIGLKRREYVNVLGVGFIGYGVSLGFQFIGTKLSTAANGALVTSATPAFVLIFATWILSERVTITRVVALFFASFGVIAVLDPRSVNLSSNYFFGNLSLIGAALTWALYSVLIRLITRDLDILTVSLVAFLGGLPLTIPISIWELSTMGIGNITPMGIIAVLYIGIVSTALAMYLWNTAFARLDASVAALTFFAQPVVGVSLGVILLDETLSPMFYIGGLLIGLGIIVASRSH